MENKQVEEIKRHFSVVAEGLEHKIQLVAEGIENVDEKLERFRQEVKEEFKETRSRSNSPMPSWIGGLLQSRVKLCL